MARELARVLARLHALTAADVPALKSTNDATHRPEDDFAQFEELLDRLTVVDSVVLDYVRVWLEQHIDELGSAVALVHGDFRLGNLVWASSQIVGILDWETARLGSPLFDVGWLCMGARRGSDPIMGLVTRDEFVRLYEEETGRAVGQRQLLLWQVAAAWVRGCAELRLLDLALQSVNLDAVDPRDLSWQFGSHRTDAELIGLIEQIEAE